MYGRLADFLRGRAFAVGSWPVFLHSGLKAEGEYSPVGTD
jgi:hypothetical protein